LSKMTDALGNWILQFNSDISWFNKLNAENTKRTYLLNIEKYCDFARSKAMVEETGRKKPKKVMID
jgi:hypothetical protein